VIVLHILGWFAAAYVLTSLIEYVPHRWAMHSRRLAKWLRSPRLAEEFEKHAQLHHVRFFGPRSFASCSDPAGRYVSFDLGADYMLVMTWWVWVPLGFYSLLGAGVLVAFLAAHGATWSAVHREMHYPQNAWFAKTAIFRFWRRYHETHHERHGANFNTLCPFFDQLFRTYCASTREVVV
jgi:hypothetical protein